MILIVGDLFIFFSVKINVIFEGDQDVTGRGEGVSEQEVQIHWLRGFTGLLCRQAVYFTDCFVRWQVVSWIACIFHGCVRSLVWIHWQLAVRTAGQSCLRLWFQSFIHKTPLVLLCQRKVHDDKHSHITASVWSVLMRRVAPSCDEIYRTTENI